jgi:hypothetical protein
MAELLLGFRDLDLVFINNRLLTLAKTIIYKEKPLKQQRKEPNSVLPFIRAAAISETSRGIIDRDIDEITEGLNWLYIL